MTLETERPTFRGVICLHCKEPVPVPAIVGNPKSATGEGESRTGRSQVFNVRCPACHKEKPYRTSEILEFEGSPNQVNLRPASPTSVRWYPQDGMARSAKA